MNSFTTILSTLILVAALLLLGVLAFDYIESRNNSGIEVTLPTNNS